MKLGDKLPSKRHLAKQYKVSLTSVQSAYIKLLEEGYIYSKERSGYFVDNIENIFKEPKDIYNLDEENTESKKEDMLCDFTKIGVDKEGFCYRNLSKVMNEIIEQDEILEAVNYQGYEPLREQIANYLQISRGVDVSKEQIIISSGTEHLMQIIFRLIEGLYAIEDPGYPTLRNILNAYKIPYVPIPLDDGGINLEYLFQSHANICVIVPEHQFPTGIRMEKMRREAILNHDNIEYIIEDDYDSEFRYCGQPKPAMKAVDTNDKVIYLGSLSRTLSPAFRLSYMVLPQKLLAKYHEKFSCFGCAVSIIMQKLITEFLKQGYFYKHINKMRKIYENKRNLIKEIAKLNDEINIYGDETGLHLVLEYSEKYNEKEIIDWARKNKVLVKGLSDYGKARTKPALLISFGSLTISEIERGIRILVSYKH